MEREREKNKSIARGRRNARTHQLESYLSCFNSIHCIDRENERETERKRIGNGAQLNSDWLFVSLAHTLAPEALKTIHINEI